MNQPTNRNGHVKKELGLFDAISIIVGIVIGAGIFETAPFILGNVSSPWLGLSAWAAGGLLSLIGALCYAELATTYPREGGDYVYLSRAFGRWVGFPLRLGPVGRRSDGQHRVDGLRLRGLCGQAVPSGDGSAAPAAVPDLRLRVPLCLGCGDRSLRC